LGLALLSDVEARYFVSASSADEVHCSNAVPFNTQPSSSEASSSEALVSAATARVPGLNEAPAQPEVFVHE